MKFLKYFTLLLFSILLFTACDKDKEEDHDDDHMHGEDIEYEYHAHINSPSAADKNVGDSIHLHVTFESHSGETVHHVNAKVYNKSDNSIVLFDGPTEAHVHGSTGEYELHEDIALNATTGVEGHSDWIVEARVWATEAGEGEVIETLEFHVHPE